MKEILNIDLSSFLPQHIHVTYNLRYKSAINEI